MIDLIKVLLKVETKVEAIFSYIQANLRKKRHLEVEIEGSTIISNIVRSKKERQRATKVKRLNVDGRGRIKAQGAME